MIELSIIIVNYNGTGFIEDCLRSIKENLFFCGITEILIFMNGKNLKINMNP